MTGTRDFVVRVYGLFCRCVLLCALGTVGAGWIPSLIAVLGIIISNLTFAGSSDHIRCRQMSTDLLTLSCGIVMGSTIDPRYMSSTILIALGITMVLFLGCTWVGRYLQDTDLLILGHVLFSLKACLFLIEFLMYCLGYDDDALQVYELMLMTIYCGAIVYDTRVIQTDLTRANIEQGHKPAHGRAVNLFFTVLNLYCGKFTLLTLFDQCGRKPRETEEVEEE